jgi:hypothetical protein
LPAHDPPGPQSPCDPHGGRARRGRRCRPGGTRRTGRPRFRNGETARNRSERRVFDSSAPLPGLLEAGADRRGGAAAHRAGDLVDRKSAPASRRLPGGPPDKSRRGAGGLSIVSTRLDARPCRRGMTAWPGARAAPRRAAASRPAGARPSRAGPPREPVARAGEAGAVRLPVDTDAAPRYSGPVDAALRHSAGRRAPRPVFSAPPVPVEARRRPGARPRPRAARRIGGQEAENLGPGGAPLGRARSALAGACPDLRSGRPRETGRRVEGRPRAVERKPALASRECRQ